MKVTLYAQPHESGPRLPKSSLRSHVYVEGGGSLTSIPFTDVGAFVWRVLLGMDEEPDITLDDAAFLGVPWSLRLEGPKLKVHLQLSEYTKADIPDRWMIELRVDGKEARVRKFLRRLLRALPAEPWDFADPGDFGRAAGISFKKCRAEWRRLTADVPKGPKLPEIVEATTALETKGIDAVFRVKVENKTSGTITAVKIIVDGEGVEPARGEQTVPRINSAGSTTGILEFRLRDDADSAALRPKVKYAGKSGPVTLELPPVRFTLVIPEPHEEAIKETAWSSTTGSYAKAEMDLGSNPVRAAEAFDDLLSDLRKLPFRLLDPKVDRRGQTYRGSIRMFGRDKEGKGLGIEVEVAGGQKDHRTRLLLLSEVRESLPGFVRLLKRGPLAGRFK